MDTPDYVKEADRQLNDQQTYKKLGNDPTKEFSTIVNQRVDKMVADQEITQKIGNILKISNPRTPQIYFLPKIHKNVIPPPGRPIVSANSCPTENISAFVDLFLNPLVPKSEHYVKDTTDFLNKIKIMGKTTSHTIIGTMDVTSLHTNIPNTEGIMSIQKILSQNRAPTENPKNKSIIDLLKLVLEKNNFQFNGQNFLQIDGTAMGTRLAPAYANLFMQNLENELLKNIQLKPTIWLRYIDDIFFIWEHGELELQKWYEYLNGTHTQIKFTIESSKREISFLDTMVKIDKRQSPIHRPVH